MKYAIVYSSRTGNARQLAEKAFEVLGEREGGECVYFGEVPAGPLEGATAQRFREAEILYAGFWTDKGNADSGILSLFKELGKTDNMPPEIILFGTAGFGADQAYYDRIIQAAACELPESVKLKASFMCQGKMQQGVLERYRSMLEANPQDGRAKLMVDNYHAALTHPDGTDMAAFQHFLISSVPAAGMGE